MRKVTLQPTRYVPFNQQPCHLACVQDDVMLAALDKNPFVVMGSPYRDIDYERVWTNELNKRQGRKAPKSTGQGHSGSSCHWAPNVT